jgi:hypothetical protein
LYALFDGTVGQPYYKGMEPLRHAYFDGNRDCFHPIHGTSKCLHQHDDPIHLAEEQRASSGPKKIIGDEIKK